MKIRLSKTPDETCVVLVVTSDEPMTDFKVLSDSIKEYLDLTQMQINYIDSKMDANRSGAV